MSNCLQFDSEDEWQYSKTSLKRPLKKKTIIAFQDQLSLNAGQKYCRMWINAPRGAFCNTFDLH